MKTHYIGIIRDHCGTIEETTDPFTDVESVKKALLKTYEDYDQSPKDELTVYKSIGGFTFDIKYENAE